MAVIKNKRPETTVHSPENRLTMASPQRDPAGRGRCRVPPETQNAMGQHYIGTNQ